MINKNTAVFIGGPFDLTKKIVSFEPCSIPFFEPLKEIKDDWNEIKECKVCVYSLCFKTKNNVLIYEFEGYKND